MSRHNRTKINLIAWTIRLVVNSICATYRVRFATPEDRDRLERMAREREPAILCCWHNQILFFTGYLERNLIHKGFPLTMMISMSKDGDLASRLAELAGGAVVRASSSKGGARGLKQLYRVIKNQRQSTIVLPDGPRGPRYEMKMGSIVLAQLTGAPIIPLAYAPKSCWTLRSWDRFIIPKPFTRITVAVGEPIQVARTGDEESQEQERLRVQQKLRNLMDQTALASKS